MRVIALVALVLLISFASAQYNANREANAKAHKTDRYRDASGKPQTKYVILRRLKNFEITVDADFASPQATFGLATSAGYAKSETQKLDVVARNGNKITLSNPGAIGIFKLTASVTGGKTFTSPEEYIFLFNPYEPKDDAHIPADAASKNNGPDIAEHIENEYGAVWLSDPTGKSWKSWIYNQYDLESLLTSQELLYPLSNAQRALVYIVARALSHFTAGKVLQGRWDGEYSDGKNPGYWSTSTEIISQYRKSKSIVKYGQCWVFASLLTTLSRTLGFASYPMTNINSAHEKPVGGRFKCDCQMNYKQTSSGYEAGDGSTCSIWNFHVWNHGWFKRPDLTGTFEHLWNAYDATWQERSSGPDGSTVPAANPKSYPADGWKFPQAFHCGPVPIAGLKQWNGCTAPKPELENFDGQFIRSESNAVTTFNVMKTGSTKYEKLRTDPAHVGEGMFFKVADSQCRGAAPTNGQYRSLCIGNAARMYSVAGTFLETENKPVAFTAQFSGVGKDSMNDAGKPFKGFIKSEDDHLKSVGVKTVDYTIVLFAENNQGKNGKALKTCKGKYDITKPKGKDNNMDCHIGAAEWKSKEFLDAIKLSDSMKMVFFAFPDKTDATKGVAAYGSEQKIRFNIGKVTLECGKKTQSIGDGTCTVTVTNYFPVALTGIKVKLVASGQGAQIEQAAQQLAASKQQIGAAPNDRAIVFLERLSQRNPVPADVIGASKGTKLPETFKVKFVNKGPTLIVATVLSKELPPLEGAYEVTVQ